MKKSVLYFLMIDPKKQIGYEILLLSPKGGLLIMARKRRKSRVFKITYIAFVAVLAILVGAALMYVNSVLELYEGEHPQRHLEKAVELLKEEAKSGALWEKDGVPSMEGGEFEKAGDQKQAFIDKLNGDIKFSNQKWINDTECVYQIISDGTAIAEIKLKKDGDAVQKLVIISIQKYELISYTPLVHTYTLELPADVVLNTEVYISVNKAYLMETQGVKDEEGKLTFTFDNMYSLPEVLVTDSKGNKANVRLPDTVDGKIEFDNCFYTLTLPENIFVDVNGERQSGEITEDGRHYYRIRLTTVAEVILSDLFGNTVKYNGASKIPLTYYTLKLTDNCTVKVDGNPIPEGITNVTANPEFKNFADLATGLPQIATHKIVVLKNNAEVTVTDKNGKEVALEADKNIQDLLDTTLGEKLETVPEEVSSKVDVLKVLEDWSLFMSNDLNFYNLSKHLITNSYQYNIAWTYNNSIDRTFFSYHTLGNPPFVEESVTNYIRLSDNCFSVDIHFIKHTIVNGERVDDEMNERCYFVNYDATNDGVNNPAWKLVGMKEIVNNAK